MAAMEDSSNETLVNESEPGIQVRGIRRRHSDKKLFSKDLSISGVTSEEDEEKNTAVNKENESNFHFQQNIFVTLKSSYARLEYGLYFTLIISQFLPTVYKSVRMYYLGDLPNASGVNIASQLIWVNLILEVFQEALILPLYYLIGQTSKNIHETKNRLKIGMLITFSIHICFSVITALLAESLAKLMVPKDGSIGCIVTYVHLELIAIPFESINQLSMVMLTIFNWQRHLYVVLVVRMAMSITIDTFFVSEMKFSLKLGVNGIGYANIATSCVICIYCIIITSRKFRFTMDDIFKMSTYKFVWLRSWINVGFFSGLDSLIRNLFYMLCVIRMMNVIEKQGVYWRANEFIWNWLLLFFIPLTNVLKQDTGNDVQGIDHKVKMTAYFGLTLTISIFWAISIPIWKIFFHYVMNVIEEDVNDIYNLVLVLCPFYVLYMLNTLFDSVLYGKGRTSYLAIQSAITNLLINLPAFILFLLKIFIPDVLSIALLFGSGIMVDNFITCYLYYRFLKSRDFKV